MPSTNNGTTHILLDDGIRFQGSSSVWWPLEGPTPLKGVGKVYVQDLLYERVLRFYEALDVSIGVASASPAEPAGTRRSRRFSATSIASSPTTTSSERIRATASRAARQRKLSARLLNLNKPTRIRQRVYTPLPVA